MPLCFEQEFHPHHYECDPWLRMTPGAMLRRIEEISTAQCEAQGIDEAYYQRTHSAFLLSRMSLLVHRPLGYGAPVRAVTAAYGQQRAVFHRVTTLYGTDGAPCAQADARWVLVDTQTRRIVRRAPEEIAKIYSGVPGEDPTAADHDMKFEKPGRLLPVGEVTASYSQCDRNGHMNNTRYADIMCDHLPLAALREGLPRQMLFVYHHEIPLGQSFTVSGAQDTENAYTFLAHEGETKFFEGHVRFAGPIKDEETTES